MSDNYDIPKFKSNPNARLFELGLSWGVHDITGGLTGFTHVRTGSVSLKELNSPNIFPSPPHHASPSLEEALAPQVRSTLPQDTGSTAPLPVKSDQQQNLSNNNIRLMRFIGVFAFFSLAEAVGAYAMSDSSRSPSPQSRFHCT